MKTEMHNCQICGGSNIKIEHVGIIRDGGLGKYTDKPVTMKRCMDCDVIWHEKLLDTKTYYGSDEYRNSLEGTAEEPDFYRLHDKETLAKLEYTGTDIYRNKVICDIGCGCGAFLDFVSGAAKKIIAIEPTDSYCKVLRRKGFSAFPYAADALGEFAGKVDVVTSFDVIEHVDDPQEFLKDAYDLLNPGGYAFIGTPTETPVMRRLLGEDYERKLLFSTQHIWVFSKKNLRIMAEKAGFDEDKIGFHYAQRYGIGNLIGWLRNRKPVSDIDDEEVITHTLDQVWKSELERNEMSDYIVLTVKK